MESWNLWRRATLKDSKELSRLETPKFEFELNFDFRTFRKTITLLSQNYIIASQPFLNTLPPIYYRTDTYKQAYFYSSQ